MFFKKKGRHKFSRSLDFRLISTNFILFILIIYFTVHSLSGDRGLFAYFMLKNEIILQSQLLATLQKEYKQLDQKARLLHPKTLDMDMLDEIARRDLGMIAQDEKMVNLMEP